MAFLSLGAMAAMAVLLAAWSWRQLAQRGTATLFVEKGQVTVSRWNAALPEPAPQVSQVAGGSEIVTQAGSRAHLMISPSVSLILEPESVVLLTRLPAQADSEPSVTVQVQRGDTWHQVQNSQLPAGRYEVRTPAAQATLSPGRYRCEVSPDGATVIEAWQGVAMVASLSTEVEVHTGEYTSVGKGLAPSVPRPLSARAVFVSERAGNADIWLLDEGGREVQLTQHEADDLTPVWSPDGTRIAFVSWRDGNSEVYVMDADGSSQVNLTRNPANDYAPSWSPDGTRIAFESMRDGTRDLYAMKVDGTEQYRLTFGPGVSLAPHWDTDGCGVVFSRIEGDSNGDGAIDARDTADFYCVGLDGGDPGPFWGRRFVFDEMVVPWVRRAVG